MADVQQRNCVESEWLAVSLVGLDMIVKFQDDPLLNRSQSVCTSLVNKGVFTLMRCNIAGT